MKLNPEQTLYIRSMGKALQVTAIFTDISAANRHMERSNDAVVAEFGKLIFLADVGDKGIKIG